MPEQTDFDTLNDRALRAQALKLALHTLEDDASGSKQVERAERYLRFLKGQSAD